GKVVGQTLRLGYLLGFDPEDDDRRVLACAAWSGGKDFPSKVFELNHKYVLVDLPLAGGRKKVAYGYAVCVGDSDLTDQDLIAGYIDHKPVGRPPEKRQACQHDLQQMLMESQFLPRKEVVKRLLEMGHGTTVIKETIAGICDSTPIIAGK